MRDAPSSASYLSWAWVVLVWSFAMGLALWASGWDVALQNLLYANYNQTFNTKMRWLGYVSLGRTQIFALLTFGMGYALYRPLDPLYRWRALGRVIWAIPCQLLSWGLATPRPTTFWLNAWNGVPVVARAFLQAIPVLAVAGLLQILGKWVIGRPRPKELLWNGTDPFDARVFGFDASFWSFPSGHSTSTFAIAVWLALYFPRWRWPLLITATMLACSRFLALTPHYVGDVIAGAGLGSAVALAFFATLAHKPPRS
jgi:membrane-associated phospholipid phosphatase